MINICLCLFACLAVGLAVPVPETTTPDNKQNLENLIQEANPEDNDIDGSPTVNQVTEESEDAAIVDSAAVTEKENEVPIEIAEGTTEPVDITTPKEVEEPEISPKVNQTKLPDAPATLEPTDENASLTIEDPDFISQPVREDVTSWSNSEEETYEYVVDQIREHLFNEGDLADVVPDENQETFEDDSQVVQIAEGLLNEGDLADVIPDENQETFEDDSQVIRIIEGLRNEGDLIDVIPDENQETFEDDSQVIRITEGLLNEGDLVNVIPDENQETYEDDSQVIQIIEGLPNEGDLIDVIPDENQETFEDDSQVVQITEGLFNEGDRVVVIPDENQETFEDEPVIPVFGAETVFEGEQIVPETNEQMPSEDEREVIIVFDEESPFMHTPEEVFPGNEEIFIIEDEIVPAPEEEEEEESFPLINGEEQVVPTYFEESMPTEGEDNEQMPTLVISKDSYFSEESFVLPPNDESIFGSSFPSSDEGMLLAGIGEESQRPVDYDQIPDYTFDGAYYPDDVSDNPFMFMSPGEYYIPDESSSGGDIENDEFSAFPENENNSFTDVVDVLNEPIPMRNDDETPALVNILVIETKPLLSEGRPTIEVINTNLPQIPPNVVFEAENVEQEPIDSDIPEYTQEDDTFTDDSELPEQSGLLTPNMLAQQPIIFPEEFVPKNTMPVFPSRWTEENFYEPQRVQLQDNVPFEPFTYSSYSKYSSNRIPGPSYGSPALPFNPYGPSQEQSFSGPNPHQQNFGEEQSEDMDGMMNDDMQPQMPNTRPLSSTSDVSIFDYEDMQENEGPTHFHLTDDVPQNSRFSNVPNRFDSFMASMMPTREDISQDFHGPNTFPLNFRNPNVDGENTGVNIFNNPFQTDGSQGAFQQNQQYDVRPSFSPYQSRYNVLSGNQPARFDSRYPIVGEPNPFNSYRPYNFYYSPYDNYNLFRTPGLYSPQPVKRYSMNYRLNYPTPLW